MRTYSEELKKQVVAEYLSGVKTTSSILSPHGIPRSNLYRWLKVYAQDKDARSSMKFSYRNFYQRGLRIKRLEAIISILKRVNCTVKSPLSEKLIEMEKLYAKQLIMQHLNQNHPCQNDTSGFGFIRFSEFCFLFLAVLIST